jgi:uncharacterized protein involved in exopolysaccharide biosynthesis
MEFYRIWRILLDHKWVVIGLPIIAACVGLGLAYVLPEQYESTALVLARPFDDIKLGSGSSDRKEVRDFPVNLSAPIDAPSKTYMEVIKSPAVAIRIVENLRLDVTKPRTHESFLAFIRDEVKAWAKTTVRTLRNFFKYGRDIPASPFDLAVEDVEQNLLVSARKDTYAFDITFRSGDPNEAAAVANMAAEIFLERSSEAYRTESARTREFFAKELDESRKAMEEARAAILAYKTSGETFELASEYNEKLKIVSDLENTLAKTLGRLAGRRVLDERTSLKTSPIAISAEAEIAELKAQISTLRAELSGYPTKEQRMNALTLTGTIAEESYKFFRKYYEDARVREAATTSEIRIVSRAVPELYPVKPLKYVYAGLSFAMALVVAIGWVLFAESLDPRVRTIHDLDDELGVPVLAAIPALKALRQIRLLE